MVETIEITKKIIPTKIIDKVVIKNFLIFSKRLFIVDITILNIY